VHIEVIDDDYAGFSAESQLGFSADDVQPSGWSSWLDSAASAIGNAASSIKKKACQFKNSLLGRAVQSSVAESVGSYVGGAVVSRAAGRIFQQTAAGALGPGAIVVGSVSALVLMNSDKAETRKWAFVTFTAVSLSALLTFLYPEMSLAAEMLGNGLGYVVGSVMGGYFALRATGDTRQLIDFEHPSRSYVARALPSILAPAYMNAVVPIQNQALSAMRYLTISNAAYFAIPVAANAGPLLSAESRFELLAAPGMMRSLLSMTDEQGVAGVANYWASCVTTNALVTQFVGNEIFKILEGDQAYNVVVRTLNHYNELLRNDPEIGQAMVEFREAFDRGEESAVLATVLSEKMLEKFPKLRLMPAQADAALKAVSGNIALTVVQAIQGWEPRVFSFHLTSERDLAYLQRFLTVYFDSFLPYALLKVVAFQGPLTSQDTQLFYQNVNQMVGQLYVQRLPVVGHVAGLLEAGVDRVIEEVLPLQEEHQQAPVQEKSVGLITWLLNVSYFVAYELYRFLVYIFRGESLPDLAPGHNPE